MGYQILRSEKIKTRQALEGRLRHATRERQPSNADPELKHLNAAERTTTQAIQLFDRRMAQLPKIRKDNVRAVEFLVGFSPEEASRLSLAQQDRYFSDARKWFEKLFGGPKNLLNVTIHADEHTSRHMTLFVMPIQTIKDEKTEEILGEKLNCKHWLGSPSKLALLQTRFNKDVASAYGLERGIQGSKAKHVEVDRFYTQVNEASQEVDLPQAEPPKHKILRDPQFEIQEAVRQRDEQLQPTFQALAAQAQEVERLRKENKELKKAITAKDKHIARLNEQIEKMQAWIRDVKDLIIAGGTRLAAYMKQLLKEREKPLTIQSPEAIEKGRVMLEAARKGGAEQIKAAWDFFQSIREASLPIVQEVIRNTRSRKLNREDAQYYYDEDPGLESFLKPFRAQRRELAEIALGKGLTVMGKEIAKIERDMDRGIEL